MEGTEGLGVGFENAAGFRAFGAEAQGGEIDGAFERRLGARGVVEKKIGDAEVFERADEQQRVAAFSRCVTTSVTLSVTGSEAGRKGVDGGGEMDERVFAATVF